MNPAFPRYMVSKRRTTINENDLAHVHEPDEVRDVFLRYLSDHGIKRTLPRRHVLDAVLTLSEHFEAEQVVYVLKEHGLSVGKATVYRTLPLLVDCGILRKIRFDVKQAYFEHAFGEKPHDHMVCRRCGRIVEFDADEVLSMRTRIARRHKFHVTNHRFVLLGLCWECSVTSPVASASPAPDARRRVTATPQKRPHR